MIFVNASIHTHTHTQHAAETFFQNHGSRRDDAVHWPGVWHMVKRLIAEHHAWSSTLVSGQLALKSSWAQRRTTRALKHTECVTQTDSKVIEQSYISTNLLVSLHIVHCCQSRAIGWAGQQRTSAVLQDSAPTRHHPPPSIPQSFIYTIIYRACNLYLLQQPVSISFFKKA